jgi:hypothetical protein
MKPTTIRGFTVLISITITLLVAPKSSRCQDTGEVIVRVDDTAGSHCIDRESESVTIFLRRVFTEKNKTLFTDDKKAGVLVRSQLSATSSDPKSTDQPNVQVPAVDLESVREDRLGRVSIALEYAVATDFVLKQTDSTTKTIDLYINLAKVKGRNGFGSVLDLAGQALNQVTIPPNPYAQAASKFLKFANSAIDTSLKGDNTEQIAHLGLKFRQGKEPDLKACESAGNERTGAIAVLRSVGTKNAELIPISNTEAQYCFRYSSSSAFELLAAKRNADGSCPAPQSFTGVSNDYVMLLLSAQPVSSNSKAAIKMKKPEAIESRDRCRDSHLPMSACGLK